MNSPQRIRVALVGGDLVEGGLNIRQYAPHGRLVEGLNLAEQYLVLTDAVFKKPKDPDAESKKKPLPALIVNKQHIIWAAPLD